MDRKSYCPFPPWVPTTYLLEQWGFVVGVGRGLGDQSPKRHFREVSTMAEAGLAGESSAAPATAPWQTQVTRCQKRHPYSRNFGAKMDAEAQLVLSGR